MRVPALPLALLGLAIAVPTAGASGPGDVDKVVGGLEAASGPRDVVVRMRANAPASRVREVLGAAPGAIPGVRLPLVDAFAARATPAQIRAMAASPAVLRVEPDRAVTTFDVSGAAGYGVAAARVDVPALDGDADGDPRSYSKDDLVAAVIDTGIDASHPDLAGKVIGFEDLVNGREDPYDDQVHGTWVSGVLAGAGATGADGLGVAPGAALVGVKVLDRHGQGSLSGIAAGIQWVVEHKDRYGVEVINLSIGDPRYCGGGQDVASHAVDAAVAAGLVVVAAAGNGGPGPCTVADPAAAAGAIALGAMADPGAGGFHLWSGSSRGPTTDGRVKPELVGPGAGMTGALSGTAGTIEASGTSAAAPFTAGTVLLMLEAAPGLSPAQVRKHLVESAHDWGAPGQDDDYGYGRLDAYAALHRAGAAVGTPPRMPGQLAFSGALGAGESAEHPVEVGDPAAPLAATVIGSAGADVDLELVGPAPTAADRGTRQETLWLQEPPAGAYTLRVTAATPASYRLDVSGHFAPLDAAPPALTLEAPASPTRDAAPRLGGEAGAAVGDFPGVVVRIRRAGDVVQVLRALPSAGRWSTDAATLPDGTYAVTAQQGDAAGNVTTSPPAELTVDTTPPATSIAAGPPARSTARDATFVLSSADASVFECRLDGGGWKPCPSPHALTGLEPGDHVLEVVAVDAAGNRDPTPATWRWTVAAEPTPTPTPTATPAATATPEPTPDPPAASIVRATAMAAASGRIRSGRLADLRSADGRSVLVAGRGRAGLTAIFPAAARPLSLEYRASSSGACRHAVTAWSRAKRRWVAVLGRSGRTATTAASLPPAVDRSRPIKVRASCARRDAAVRLRVDVLRGVAR